ncbi:hypothetical protein ALP45_200113 [Pseudomonas coronafaciens pv. atropurpurea]|nr:hypothetical protein ALP45_200113 [Pseudomonas coronafaciens pv. atropurpurea]
MLNRIEYPQAGVGTVARDQNHFDPRPAQADVEVQQFFYQSKSIALLEDAVLVLNLILAIGLNAIRHVHRVAVTQVEQRSG